MVQPVNQFNVLLKFFWLIFGYCELVIHILSCSQLLITSALFQLYYKFFELQAIYAVYVSFWNLINNLKNSPRICCARPWWSVFPGYFCTLSAPVPRWLRMDRDLPTVMLTDACTDPWTQGQGTFPSLYPQFCHEAFILDPLLISCQFN